MTISKKMIGVFAAITMIAMMAISFTTYVVGYEAGCDHGIESMRREFALVDGKCHYSIPINGVYYDITVTEGRV